MSRKWCLYDLETTTMIGEGGRKHEDLEISVIGYYTSWNNKIHVLTTDQIGGFFIDLNHSDMLVGFNSIGFDNKVLQKYAVNHGMDLNEIPQFDIMKEARKTAGNNVSLERFAIGTFNEKKAGEGKEAPTLWKAGRIDDLIEYNRQDVDLTVRIFKHACMEGFLYYVDKETESIKERINTSDWVMQGRRIIAGIDKIREVMKQHNWTTVQINKVESFLNEELKK